MSFNELKWTPIEGAPKKKRKCNINTKFSKKRADHRNAILKDWAIRLEPTLEPTIPENYISPFDKNKCAYCLSSKIGPSGDEFRPSTQRGRQNIINCIPCCGMCNSSKQDKCGTALLKWIKNKVSTKQQDIILHWYTQYEKYMIISLEAFDEKNKKSYNDVIEGLDDKLNKIYEELC